MTVTAPLFQPDPAVGAPQPVDIVQIIPAGFPDAGVFTEVAETLTEGFRALGYAAEFHVNSFRFGAPVIILAAHLVRPQDTLYFPAGSIIYNLEQIRPGAWAANPGYLDLLRRHTVWDCNAENARAITAATANTDVHHVRIGFVPGQTRIHPVPAQDIDVLFYGSVTPRRAAVLQALSAAGVRVHAAFRVYGAERDALIARSRVVLNMHAHEGWGFEIVRVSYLLANGKAVVCEATTPDDVEPDLRDAVLATPYDRLVEACQGLLRNESARRALQARGQAIFRQRDEAALLHDALRRPRPDPVHGPRAAGDGADAYLDLLARTLTNEIYGDPPFDYWSGGRYDPDARRMGRDWPSQAMTMIGAARLANIRHLVESVLARGVRGDLIETGAWRGGACIFMRGILKAYGVRDRRVWVADSFAGLPPPDPRHPADAGDTHHTHAQLAVGLDEVRANFAAFNLLDDQVAFLPGWFADTLPAAPIERLAVLRLDGDMYGSTMDALAALYRKVSAGGYVIVDDYGAVPACRQAVEDFRRTQGIAAPIQDIDGLGVFWQVPG